MTWLALSFAIGIAIGWTAARYAFFKRQGPGTVTRDFSAPGMPFAGIADEMDAAVRGDA